MGAAKFHFWKILRVFSHKLSVNRAKENAFVKSRGAKFPELRG